jgi:hypothetical protein
MSEAGWQPDPDGRHEYRYWDGTSWTDQVSDGGVVSNDPPGPPPVTEAVPTYAAAPVPEAAPEGRKAPVALLAVIGLVVVVLVAGLVLVLTGGDDGGGDEGDEVATTEDDEDDASDELTDDLSDDSTGDVSDQLTDDFSEDLTDDFTDDFSEDFTDDNGDVVTANALDEGDCVVDEATLTSAQVEAIDCGQPHVYELIGRFHVTGQEFPGDAELNAQGQERCTGQIFEDYVGIDYASSVTYVSPLNPTRETWEQADDRTVLCFAHTSDQTPTTGSVQGSGQ